MAQRLLLRPIGLIIVPRTQLSLCSRSFSTVLDAPVDPRTQQITPPTRVTSVFDEALNAKGPRTNWSKEEISEVYNTSLIDLTHAAVR